MAKFQKGNPGRPKGAKNKKTLAKKEELETMFRDEIGFKGLIDNIKAIEDPYYAFQAKVKLLEFFMPKLKAVDLTANIEDTRKHRTPAEIQADLDKFNDD